MPILRTAICAWLRRGFLRKDLFDTSFASKGSLRQQLNVSSCACPGSSMLIRRLRSITGLGYDGRVLGDKLTEAAN
ncbi:MAG: hypothetical protein ACR2HJ_05205 [Fimbriimonadales bacterium]